MMNTILDTKTCEKCGGIMLKEITNYTEEYMTEKIVIEGVEGYKCGRCGNKHIDPNIMKYVKNKVNIEKIRHNTRQNNAYILVSKIRKIRQERGLSQREMGEMLGFSEQRYGTIERLSNIPLVTIEHKIAKVFNVKPEDLYEMFIIDIDFYEKLLNLEYRSNRFEYIEEIAEMRKQLKEKKLEQEKINIERRTYSYLIKTNQISKQEGKEKIKKLNKRLKDIKEERHGNDKSKGLERKFKELLTYYNIVLKLEEIIDYEDWQRILEEFGDEIVIH